MKVLSTALISIVMLVISSGVAAQNPASIPPAVQDNVDLKAIFDADQADRTNGSMAREPEAVLCRDRRRREITLEHFKSGKLRTAVDYFRAAMVFQHSMDDIRLAHALSTIAAYLDPSKPQYRWLSAASWDRLLTQHVQPQWYGTQYQSDEHGMFLYPVAEGAVNDEERLQMGVPTLAAAQRMAMDIPAIEGKPARKAPAPTIAQLQAKARSMPLEPLAGTCEEK